ncbi:carbohydrate-binding module family 21 protein [Jaapia argillacea MUCL 33604]|uniref:Carbohydrate-binding module family 21 protein n=1 Tax=Jaapia argillacea MUCL 33604 TaxID=933084 RepID=A0A067PXY7_9AGAM|nr:carbohydrate-binding module family 21 protein [Jaapia argillacea MUCL 33604]
MSMTMYSTPMEHSFSRDSNSAGAPLPSIPRRTSSSRSSRPQSISPPSSTLLIVQPPTPQTGHQFPSPPSIPGPDRISLHGSMNAESSSCTSSSSSESSPITFRARRVRGQRSPPALSPSEDPVNTPTPSVAKPRAVPSKPLSLSHAEDSTPEATPTPTAKTSDVESPRPIRVQNHSWSAKSGQQHLRMQSETITARRNGSELRIDDVSWLKLQPRPSTTSPTPSGAQTPPIRKKSGEIVKSSLKSRKHPFHSDLSIITAPSTSKSEPATPNKSVHFDRQLEKVKLFLAEQKPTAVSRDGSPTDTSGTDSDFPSFIYGSDEDKKKDLVMHLGNFPSVTPKDADVALEELTLSKETKTIDGKIRVRNLAFEKWIAIRFTFDWWQTTSEVTGKYVESLEAGFDRFSFSIRLNDILAKIEEKTMFLAVRYTVAGKEIWDNNGGENYQAKFSWVKPSPSKSEPNNSAQVGISDLKNRLEQVAKGRETIGSFLAQSVKRSTSDSSAPFSLKSEASLSSRYTFANSAKTPWKASDPVTPAYHARTSTYPPNVPSPNSIPWPTKRSTLPRSSPRTSFLQDPRSLTRGSPRLTDDEELRPVIRQMDDSDEDKPFKVPSRRNHQRGYFDIGLSSVSSLKKTPPGSPRDTTPALRLLSPSPEVPSIPRFVSCAPAEEHDSSPVGMPADLLSPWPPFRRVLSGASDESTPSITSPSDSSRSCSPSPEPSLPFDLPSFNSGLVDERQMSPSNYSAFLNRFCFYTGSDSILDISADAVPRSHSASSIEGYLHSPPREEPFTPPFSPNGSHSHTRSPSFDDIIRSGSSTPTQRSLTSR